jgi:bifunctional non-homologous end joining protein LigD
MTRHSAAEQKRKYETSHRSAPSPLFGAVKLTHADRKVFPDGRSKGDVAHYYAAVMPYLLAALANRPLSVVRCPDGISAACFFQKHMTAGLRLVHNTRLHEESGGSSNYLYVESADEVFELVQFNALEFHPWATRIDDTERTDYLVFDLDPGPGVTWSRVAAAAQLVHERCSAEGLAAFLRTSGGKGLHVVVPLRPAVPWSIAKDFAQAFAHSIAESRPHDFIATASKQRRQGKIFIDYLRNTRGATSIASYSLRARPGAPVATPLRWDELSQLKNATGFTLRNVPARLRALGADPWQNFDSIEQTLDGSQVKTI